MKILYIESKLKNLNSKIHGLEILPKELFLAYSIQYKDLAVKLKSRLMANNIKISSFKQVFGCSKIKTSLPVLFIGSGRFHAINLYSQAKRIFILEGDKIIEIKETEIEKIKAHKKTALLKFLSSKNIGLLVSTKPGQKMSLKKVLELKKQLEKGKSVYVFITDNIDINQFENFNIDSWVNTACQGLGNDITNIINYQEIQ